MVAKKQGRKSYVRKDPIDELVNATLEWAIDKPDNGKHERLAQALKLEREAMKKLRRAALQASTHSMVPRWARTVLEHRLAGLGDATLRVSREARR